jgi:hypothetical protein
MLRKNGGMPYFSKLFVSPAHYFNFSPIVQTCWTAKRHTVSAWAPLSRPAELRNVTLFQLQPHCPDLLNYETSHYFSFSPIVQTCWTAALFQLQPHCPDLLKYVTSHYFSFSPTVQTCWTAKRHSISASVPLSRPAELRNVTLFQLQSHCPDLLNYETSHKLVSVLIHGNLHAPDLPRRTPPPSNSKRHSVLLLHTLQHMNSLSYSSSQISNRWHRSCLLTF